MSAKRISRSDRGSARGPSERPRRGSSTDAERAGDASPPRPEPHGAARLSGASSEAESADEGALVEVVNADEDVDGADSEPEAEEFEFESDPSSLASELSEEFGDGEGLGGEDGESDDSTELVLSAGDARSLAPSDPLQVYMREVQRHPLLTRGEEQELAQRYVGTGDVEAAARLVTANLRLVVKIAYEYRRAFRNMMDLIQEGNIGLMQAVKRYDPYRGVKLSSYAAWWIRAYMLRYMLNNWRMVKLGTTQAQRKLFFNLNKEKARLSAMGIEPTHAEVAQRLSVDEKEVVEMDRRLSRGDASLDAPVGGDEGGKAVARVELLTATAPGPEQQATNAELSGLVRDQLQRFRTTLMGKDAIIFDKRMVADEPLTLQELGDEFGVSRERVRQLEARIASRLRVFLQESLGDAFLSDQTSIDVTS